MKKVLVTGGLGFVGSTLVKKLKQEGKYDITVIDNLSSPSSNASYKEEGVEYIIDDILNIDNISYKDLNFEQSYSSSLASSQIIKFSVLNSDLSLNVEKTIYHAEKLIDKGCHGTAIFGSTGQSQLLSISEKIE